MDYLASLIGVDLPEGNFETVAGYCISKFGRIPSVGEAVVVQFDLDAWEHEGDLPAEHVQPMYRILVTDADARKLYDRCAMPQVKSLRMQRMQPEVVEKDADLVTAETDKNADVKRWMQAMKSRTKGQSGASPSSGNIAESIST
eukprot:scaffold3347_cov382-Prasinococcus_capsulatus_cf.AAC.4